MGQSSSSQSEENEFISEYLALQASRSPHHSTAYHQIRPQTPHDALSLPEPVAIQTTSLGFMDSSHVYPEPNDIRFHSVHGTNIHLLHEGRAARRGSTFCDAIVFSSRPVACGEVVRVRCNEVATSWSGVLRFGFTNKDPSIHQSLPRYVCPDLSLKPGYWAKSLDDGNQLVSNDVLHFYYDRLGDIYFNVNGDSSGDTLFLSGLEPHQPHWCVFDVYGNSVEIQLLPTLTSPSLPPRLNGHTQGPCLHSCGPPLGPPSAPPSPLPHPSPTGGAQGFPPHRLSPFHSTPVTGETLEANTTPTHRHSPVTMPSRVSSTPLLPLSFHAKHGVNVTIDPDTCTATRVPDSYHSGQVFIASPLYPGQLVHVCVRHMSTRFVGGLIVGVTSCDPAGISTQLPRDSHLLLDREEFWAVTNIPDAIGRDKVISLGVFPFDEAHHPPSSSNLQCSVPTSSSNLQCSVPTSSSNLQRSVPTSPQQNYGSRYWLAYCISDSPFDVDISGDDGLPTLSPLLEVPALPTFLLLDLFGRVRAIQLLGMTVDPSVRLDVDHLYQSTTAHSSTLEDHLSTNRGRTDGNLLISPRNPSAEHAQSQDSGPGDCILCMERRACVAIIPCGHVSLCAECARMLSYSNLPNCPICRQEIHNIMKIYF